MQAYFYKELQQGKEGEFILLFWSSCFLLHIFFLNPHPDIGQEGPTFSSRYSSI